MDRVLMLVIFALCLHMSAGQDCGVGTYVSGNTCEDCPAGTFTDQINQPDCTNCSAGSFGADVGQANCTECFLGTFSDTEGQTQCQGCPTGSYANETGQVECQQCPAGTYANETDQWQCQPCPAGSYNNDTGQSECQTCAAGSSNNVPDQSMCGECSRGTFANETGQSVCWNCPAGSYSNSSGQSGCQDCPQGTASRERGSFECLNCLSGTFANETGQSECSVCSAGTYTDLPGQSECTDCAAGSYKNDSGREACTECDPGSFTNTTGQIKCQECPLGSYANESGSVSCRDCPLGTFADTAGQAACVNCSAGTFADAVGQSGCQDCPAGSYTNTTGESECQSCPAGSITATTGEATCTDCQPGTFVELTGQSACTDCPRGTYTDMTGEANCTSCQLGWTTPQTTSNSGQDCSIELCRSGEYYESPNCTSCPLGRFQAEDYHLLATCDQCTDSFTTENTAATSGTQCFLSCAAGAQPNTTEGIHQACEPCPIASYQPSSGKPRCLVCDPLTSTRTVGADNSSLCEEYCADGEQTNSSGQCEPCPVGYYHNSSDGLYQQCVVCPPQYITQFKGSISIDNCTIANCSVGSYRNVSENTCVACPLGTYQSEMYAEDSCTNCGQSFTTLHNSSTTTSDCFLSCDAGKYNMDNETCLPCPLGLYKDVVGPALSCTLCPPENRTEFTGSDSVEDCDIGNCTEGQYTMPDRTCEMCAVGTYQDSKWQNHCLDCGSNTAGVQLTTTTLGTRAKEDCFDPLARHEPVITSVNPPHGPISGGTNITITGRGFRATSILVFLGNNVQCVVFSWDDTTVLAQTPDMNMNGSDSFPLIIELDGRNNVSSNNTFTYRPDPVLTALYPASTIRQGGTTLTVEGTNMNSVANPILVSTAVITTVGAPEATLMQTYYSDCEVINSTLMFCVLPEWDFPEDLVPENSTSRRRRDIRADPLDPEGDRPRQRRATLDRELRIYLGIILDGLDAYINISALDDEMLQGILTLVRTPNFADQTFRFNPNTAIGIKGNDMRTLHMSQFAVVIGRGGICTVQDVTDDRIHCLPPQEKPPNIVVNDGDHPRVLVSIGANFNVTVGTISYGELSRTTIILIAVLASIGFLLVVIGIVLLIVFMRKKQRKSRERRAQHEQQTGGIITLPGVTMDSINGSVASIKRGASLAAPHSAGGVDRLLVKDSTSEHEDHHVIQRGGFVMKKRPPLDSGEYIMYKSNPHEAGRRRLKRRPVSEIPTMTESDEDLSQVYNNFRSQQPSQGIYLRGRDMSGPDGSPGTSDPRKVRMDYQNDAFDDNENLLSPRPKSAVATKEGLEFDSAWSRAGEDDGPRFSDRMMDMLEGDRRSPLPHVSTDTANIW